MQLNDALAHQIVSRAMKILSFSVNVMDERGLIIASGNPERLHQRHAPWPHRPRAPRQRPWRSPPGRLRALTIWTMTFRFKAPAHPWPACMPAPHHNKPACARAGRLFCDRVHPVCLPLSFELWTLTPCSFHDRSDRLFRI